MTEVTQDQTMHLYQKLGELTAQSSSLMGSIKDFTDVLRRLEDKIDRALTDVEKKIDQTDGDMKEKISHLQSDYAVLKTKVAFWGAIFGVVGATLVEVISRFLLKI
jgi:predicted  nucleic acid-binding Zn-ribbon protein